MDANSFTLIYLVIQIPCVLFATTIHEFSRAVSSTLFGDKKPKEDGRLTLNPLKHFEPIGFILAWTNGFGWGKPVETKPMFYKNKKQGTIVTALVPSLVNITFAFLFGLLFKFLSSTNMFLYFFVQELIRFNVSLAVYNLVPITPMDCLKVLGAILPANLYFQYIQYEKILQMIFLLLLFWGYTDFIFIPIISFIMNIVMI